MLCRLSGDKAAALTGGGNWLTNGFAEHPRRRKIVSTLNLESLHFLSKYFLYPLESLDNTGVSKDFFSVQLLKISCLVLACPA
jgi:hypothetical protein